MTVKKFDMYTLLAVERVDAKLRYARVIYEDEDTELAADLKVWADIVDDQFPVFVIRGHLPPGEAPSAYMHHLTEEQKINYLARTQSVPVKEQQCQKLN